VEKLIAPMKKMAKDSPNKTARKRATEALDDARLGRWKSRKEIPEESEEEEDEDEEDGDDGEFGGFDD
jgi:ribosomal RNA-processing protein 1